MLKNLIQLEHKIGDSVFHFSCAADAQLEHAKDALFKFLGHCAKVEEDAKVKAQEAPVQPEVASDPTPSEVPNV